MEFFSTPIFLNVALLLTIACGAALLLVRDRRTQVGVIFIVFLVAVLIFINTLPSYLVLAKAIAAIIVTIMFFATAWQVHWIETPELTSAIESGTMSIQAVSIEEIDLEATAPLPLDNDAPRRLSPAGISVLIFRGLIVIFLSVVALRLAGFETTQAILNLSPSVIGISFVMVALGIAVIGLTEAPFRAGLGMVMLLTGFDLVYALLQPSLAVVAMLAIVNICVALGTGYLTLVRAERFLEVEEL